MTREQGAIAQRFCGYVISAVLFALVAGELVTAGEKPGGDAFVQNQKLGRGVNIIGYDPLWRSRDQARFKVGYFQMLKDAGFSNVRINLHPFRGMDQSNDYGVPASWWETLDWAVTNALKSDLMVILDLHEFGAMGTDPETNKPKFLAFWRQASERFRAAPDNVLFEILNEPSRKLSAEMWNQYLAEALVIIRETNPTRTVIIGPAGYNAIGQLPQLKLPEDDRHIIVTVHYYSPMDFTHQGAPWAGRQDKVGVEWQGTAEEKAAIERDFARAQTWAKEHNRPLFLGEFGVYDKAPMDSRVRYLTFVVGTAQKLGWSWAYWQFDSDFILYDVKAEKWIEPVRDALTGQTNRLTK
ncbi:MAG: glycoside hydrolase family 5 protein [Sedimentisphaerales bacterium]|nr:glycoside hydrolase family 5 protein [Sedimentisphaerales bacterium]